jgi:hypothetical protein
MNNLVELVSPANRCAFRSARLTLAKTSVDPTDVRKLDIPLAEIWRGIG